IEAIHINWRDGAPKQGGFQVTAEMARRLSARLKPKEITAAMIGLKSPISTFRVQRFVNTFEREPLTAAMPALTLYEMWGLVGTAETALFAVSIMVVITSLIGMMAMILATLTERRREIAILRAMGAGPRTVIGLLLSEAGILAVVGVGVGLVTTYAGLAVVKPIINERYGLFLEMTAPTSVEWMVLGAVVFGGILAGLIPAIRAYRMSLADGMTVRS
ncbi:MAG: FtsX-like permease family protein, partial [Pseudomonadota bacterium]